MENGLYDSEFEKYLKQQADQHRMYPADQVWRNINQEIHGYSKWPGFTIISVFIIAALLVGTVTVKPRTDMKTAATSSSDQKKAALTTSPDNIARVNTNNISIQDLTQQTIASASKKVETQKAILSANHLLAEVSPSIIKTGDKPVPELKTLNNPVSANNANLKNENISDNEKAEAKPVTGQPLIFTNTNFFNTAIAVNNVLFILPGLPNSRIYSGNFYTGMHEFKDHSTSVTQLSLIYNSFHKEGNTSPLSKLSGASSRYDFQFYVTPSISYRRLVDNAQGALSKSYISALPYAANYVVDVNQVIQHRPAAGYEVGASLGYNINSKFALRTGLQFNVRQYNINAFAHSTEPAAIALSTGYSNGVFNTVSGFRNYPGSKPIILKNRYYEISLPLGVDWRPVNGKFSWGIAASVQPTYTFDKEPFIITSNYKNYADGSQLMRNWNLNTNVETYLGYNTGKYRWQVGPQVRYQLLPTMDKSYPIKEFLVDYGLKLSLVRSLR